MERQEIREPNGRIVGFLETLDNGDIQARVIDGRIVGFYRKASNTTIDISGRIIARGNIVASLIWENKSN
ncbi:MAG: hypothetical protein IJH31_07030 [Erysipelotrichaceae bacterium]|nr:hypothetical protein [Erysipelotrichaceae bacterium]